MSIQLRSRITVFILSFLVWVALTNIRDIQEVIAGIVVAFIVTMLAGQFFLTTNKEKHIFHRLGFGILYIFKFLWEMIKANIHVAWIVIQPGLPIKPAIVKIQSNLTKDMALTVLSNSITLTPGTLTVDIEPDKKELYIHWIDASTTDVKEATEEIGARFEKLLMEVFE